MSSKLLFLNDVLRVLRFKTDLWTSYCHRFHLQ